MSGLYLVVWDDKDKEKSAVLRPTSGGYPHITVAYTGKNLDVEKLTRVSGWLMQEWCLKSITITKAYVNSFRKDDGTERHDVLLAIAEEAEIEKTRNAYVHAKFENSDKFFMRTPHITHGIYETRMEAERVCELLNDGVFPYTVKVTGVTID